MMFQKALILLALTCADAFTFSPSASRVAFSNQLTHQQSPIANAYTRLYAEESEEVEAEAAEVAPKEVKSSGNTADDILNSPAFLSRKLDVLNSDVAAVTEKIEAANALYEENKEEWGPQIEKLRSEYATMSDRLDKQSKTGSSAVAKDIAVELLSVLDNYDRAFKSVDPETDEEKETEALYLEVYNMIIASLGELGVKPVETVGIEFDYEFHQAVMMRPDEDYEEGIVCEELQKGWSMEDGFLIRAAMVVVAA